jgi:excisionase family DNA binding protein
MVSDSALDNPVKEPEAAEHVGQSIPTLRKWRREGKGPAYLRIGRSIRYRPSDLDAFLTRHRVETRDSRAR